MADRHTRRDSVRIHDHVRYDAFSSERQVLLSVSHAASTLLSMSTGELVTDLRDSHCSHLYLSKELRVLIRGDDHLVNDARLS